MEDLALGLREGGQIWPKKDQIDTKWDTFVIIQEFLSKHNFAHLSEWFW